jgi:hypothetical protein
MAGAGAALGAGSGTAEGRVAAPDVGLGGGGGEQAASAVTPANGTISMKRRRVWIESIVISIVGGVGTFACSAKEAVVSVRLRTISCVEAVNRF